jgi:hypothetical protein
MREVSSTYAALSQGEVRHYSHASPDYPDWVASVSHRPSHAASANFWSEYLEGIPDCLALPLTRPRPSIQSHAGKTYVYGIPEQLRTLIERVSASLGVTLHQFFSAALLLVLSEFTGQRDIIVGASHANRVKSDQFDLCGIFLDRIPFRMRPTEEDESSVESLIRSVVESQQAALLHFDLPFDDIVKYLRFPRNLSRHPIFQVMLSVENEKEAQPKLHINNAFVESELICHNGANVCCLCFYFL